MYGVIDPGLSVDLQSVYPIGNLWHCLVLRAAEVVVEWDDRLLEPTCRDHRTIVSLGP